MKVRIFEENPAPREKEVIIRLVYHYEKPCLVVVDESGKEVGSAMIIFINNDGTFTRANGLKESLGLNLDERGRIIET